MKFVLIMATGTVLFAASLAEPFVGSSPQRNVKRKEILERRTPTSRTYDNGDGTYTAVIRASSVVSKGIKVQTSSGQLDQTYCCRIEDGTTKTASSLYIGYISGNYRRSCSKFDISSIPDDEDVTGIKFVCKSNAFGGAVMLYVTEMDNDPESADASTLWSDIEGITYASQNITGNDTWTFNDLGASAHTKLESMLTSDWFALGMYPGASPTGWAGFSTLTHYIEVTYGEACGGAGIDATDQYTLYDGSFYDDIETGKYSGLYCKACVEFDVTSIQDGSKVTRIDFYIASWQTEAGTETYFVPTQMDNQISGSSYTTLWNDIGSGPEYSSEWHVNQTGYWYSETLNADANSKLESQLTADWFGIGLNPTTNQPDSNLMMFYEVTSSYPPYINVTYGTKSLAEALDNTSYFFESSGGNWGWFGQTTTTHDGTDAAQSADIDDNEESSFQTTVNGPGTITFWWKVSSETNYDYLRFYDGETELDKISGEVDWTYCSFDLGAGSHTLKWQYDKDVGASSGNDCGWVDQVGGTATLIELSYFKANPFDSRVLIEWKTETELDSEGFNLLRSEEEAGEYVQINCFLIPSKGEAGFGAEYSYIDYDVKNEVTYYYKLEEIDTYGKSTLYGPVSATPNDITIVWPRKDRNIFSSDSSLFMWSSFAYSSFKIDISSTPNFTESAILSFPEAGWTSSQSLRLSRGEWEMVLSKAQGNNGRLFLRVRAEDEDGQIVYSYSRELVFEELSLPTIRQRKELHLKPSKYR